MCENQLKIESPSNVGKKYPRPRPREDAMPWKSRLAPTRWPCGISVVDERAVGGPTSCAVATAAEPTRSLDVRSPLVVAKSPLASGNGEATTVSRLTTLRYVSRVSSNDSPALDTANAYAGASFDSDKYAGQSSGSCRGDPPQHAVGLEA